MSAGDPQLPDEATDDRSDSVDDVRPIVADQRRSFAVPLFIGGLAVAALLLFSALNAQRRALSAPETRAPVGSLVEVESRVPPLYVPPAPIRDLRPPQEAITEQPAPVAVFDPPVFAEPLSPDPGLDFPPEPIAVRPIEGGSPGTVLVYDRSGTRHPAAAASAEAGTAPSSAQTAGNSNQRVRAGRLSNPSTTVIQGTVIPAVLETAIDTNRSGPARAIVSQDVSGFDGTRVLIPRGSRLVGEYGTSLAAGQNRVLVEWTRLIRPDGATIALDSPSADRLGRAGIRGDVNSHFWERFASAIFRTALDVGAVVAARQIDDGAFVILPQNVREAGRDAAASSRVQRTLTVDQGAAVSVFVARDLDFTPVERRR